MVSIVTDILSSAGKLQRDELGTKIGALSCRIAELKNHVQDTLRVSYSEFMTVSVRTTELAAKYDNYSNELNMLNNLVENELVPQIRESSVSFRDVRRQLAIASETLQIVNRLVAVHEALESSESNLESLDKLDELTDDLLRTWGDGDDQIGALAGLKIECTVRREKLMHDLSEIWKECVVWDINDDGKAADISDDDAAKSRPSAVTILHVTKMRHVSPTTLDELMCAMHRLKYLEPKLRAFARHLLKHVVLLILAKTVDVTWTVADNDNSKATLRVSVCSTMRPCPSDVFAKLHTMFDFLDNSFGSSAASGSSSSQSMKRLFGDVFCVDFYDVLIKECLRPAVPCQRKDLEAFARVVKAASKLQARLVEMGMTDEDDLGIVAYARNSDVLFANKMCQEILVKARQLMLGDLHEAIRPSDEHDAFVVESSSGNRQTPQNQLDDNILKFPACQISKSAYDFVQLLYSVMEEATSSSQLCAGRLFVTAKNAVELYCDVVPTHHKDRLESLPQQAALFHNNCMYVAHHLRTLGQQFHGRLPGSMSDKEKTITFVDQIPIMRELGAQVFLEQMRRQRRQLLTTMDGFQEAIVDAKMAQPTVERPVKRCVHQLQHLKAVWTDVLPIKVFNRALGTLINSMLEDVVQRVVALEDLPAEGATHLIAVFGVVKDQVPLLFQVSEDEEREIAVHRHVGKWPKFTELLLVLAAPLAGIVDRWSEGKGPLAQEFTVDEVKRMIRALFQNTDRRAAALSRIK